ncbi:MAG: hypothetical protein HQK53_03165 [Oligoflexia bacterium]|nr:hypothetical protein [Oligoflexia bacterium]
MQKKYMDKKLKKLISAKESDKFDNILRYPGEYVKFKWKKTGHLRLNQEAINVRTIEYLHNR